MNFFSRPFIYLTPAFCLGILLGESPAIMMLLSAILMLLFISLFLVIKRSNSTRWLVNLSFVVALVLLGQLSSSFSNKQSISVAELAPDKELTAIIKVLEVDQRDVLTTKLLCETVSFVGNEELVQHSEKVVIYTHGEIARENDLLLVRTRFMPIENKKNPGEFDSKAYWASKNVYSLGFLSPHQMMFIKSVEESILGKYRRSINDFLHGTLEKYLKDDQLAVVKALVLGDKSLLTPETKAQFSSAGAMHVLAVSGLHVGIILEILIFIFGRFPRIFSRNAALIISVGIIWIYAGVIDFPPSVVRAGFMFSLLVLGRLLGRQNISLNSLFFAGFVMLLVQPLWLFDIGFQLSFLAMIGIVTLYDRIHQFFYVKNWLLNKIWSVTVVGISAQVFTIPLTLYYFHQFPNYFMLTNVGMMIFAGLLLTLTLILFAIKWLSILAKGLAILLAFSTAIMLLFVSYIDGLPGAVAEGFGTSVIQVGLAYVLLIAVVVFNQKWVKIGAVISGVLLIGWIQFDRYQLLSTKEVLLLNSPHLVMMFNNGGEIVCVHNAAYDRVNRVEYLAEAYRKLHGGSLKLHALKYGETEVSFGEDEKFIINQISDGYLIRHNLSDRDYFIRKGYEFPPVPDEKVIDMAFHMDNFRFRNARNGAVKLEF